MKFDLNFIGDVDTCLVNIHKKIGGFETFKFEFAKMGAYISCGIAGYSPETVTRTPGVITSLATSYELVHTTNCSLGFLPSQFCSIRLMAGNFLTTRGKKFESILTQEKI